MAAAARLTPLTTRLVVEWNPKNPNAATVLQYLLQANLDLRNSNLSWLNLTMFDLRKICVREQKTNVLYRWICKLRSFLNRDSTVLYTAHCTVLPQPWFTPFFWRSLLPFWQNFECNKTVFLQILWIHRNFFAFFDLMSHCFLISNNIFRNKDVK